MIKLNTEGETVGAAFGIPTQRAEQLVDLLQAAGNAYVNGLVNSDEPRITLDKIKIAETFSAYAENEAEQAFCFFHAGQAAKSTEEYLNNTYRKSFFQ